MITSNLTASYSVPRPVGVPSISFPFLWQDKRGVVWLRTQDGRDTCQRPIAGFAFGQLSQFPPPHSVAWQKRLAGDVALELRNEFGKAS